MTCIKPPTPAVLYISLHTNSVNLKEHATVVFPCSDARQLSRNAALSLNLLPVSSHLRYICCILPPSSVCITSQVCVTGIKQRMTWCPAACPVCVKVTGLLLNMAALSYSPREKQRQQTCQQNKEPLKLVAQVPLVSKNTSSNTNTLEKCLLKREVWAAASWPAQTPVLATTMMQSPFYCFKMGF